MKKTSKALTHERIATLMKAFRYAEKELGAKVCLAKEATDSNIKPVRLFIEKETDTAAAEKTQKILDAINAASLTFEWGKKEFSEFDAYNDALTEAHKRILSLDAKRIIDWLKNNDYEEKKAQLRQEAIDYQNEWDEIANVFYILEKQEYFTRKGRKYGLLKEFRENAII